MTAAVGYAKLRDLPALFLGARRGYDPPRVVHADATGPARVLALLLRRRKNEGVMTRAEIADAMGWNRDVAAVALLTLSDAGLIDVLNHDRFRARRQT